MSVSEPLDELSQLVLLKRTPILQFVMEAGGSVRLSNTLRAGHDAGKLPFQTIGEYLDAGEEADALLLRLPNLGRGTARELRALVESALRAGCTTTSALSAWAQGSREALDEVLQVLDARERETITLRFGLGGIAPKTLAEVGDEFGVTRERARQIEAKAIDKLRGARGAALTALLSERAGDIWRKITRGSDALAARDLRDAARNLEPFEELAIAIAYKSFSNWLGRNARTIKGGWVAKDANLTEIREASDALKHAFDDAPEPSLLRSIVRPSTVSLASLRVAALVSSRVREYCGYLVRRPLRKRVRRVIRTHLLFEDQPLRMPILTRQLREQYVARFPDDVCSIRDLEIVMGEAPHLFLDMYEEGWVALAEIGERDGALIDELEDYDEATRRVEEELARDETIAGTLRSLLDESGPQAFDELRRLFLERTKNRFSKSSVGPILLTHDEFVRFAPGVYGLRSQLETPEAVDQALQALMNPHQLELYCHARWAGEPTNLFPMWTPATERAWAVWTKREGLESHLFSLLAVADVSAWRVNGEELARWVWMQQKHGTYQLEEGNPFALTETLPRLEDVVAVAVSARARGNASWMSANRVRGLRLDDRHSHSVLALLVALGVLEAPSHWQRRHVFLVEAYALVDQLMTELERSSGRRWTPHAIELLVKQAKTEREWGWVDERELSVLIDELSLLIGHMPRLKQEAASDGALDELLQARRRERALRLVDQ